MSLTHKIALTLLKNVGAVQVKKLLQVFGDATAIFDATAAQLQAVPGIGKKTAQAILRGNALGEAEKQLAFIRKHKINVLFYTDEAYPARLRHCYDAPVLLYFRGEADFNRQRIIAIVGSRMATAYGKLLCKKLVETLALYDVLIISGLAYGIDVLAHQECLQHDIPTVAVLGHGLDRIYPPGHVPVARKMVANGGLLTEFLPGTLPNKENFPKRNRIIAGLCDALVVVEASAKGGALITADIADSYFREVYAFPGRATDVYSEGCNFLIKTHRAALINHPDDLIWQLGWEKKISPAEMTEVSYPAGLGDEARQLLSVLQDKPMNIDELLFLADIPRAELSMLLLELELSGIIAVLPGKRYQSFITAPGHI